MFIQWDGDVCIETVFEPDELVPSEYAYKCAARESWLHLPEGHRAVEGLRYMRRMTPDERKRYLTRFRIVVDGKAYEMENVSMCVPQIPNISEFWVS